MVFVVITGWVRKNGELCTVNAGDYACTLHLKDAGFYALQDCVSVISVGLSG